jgi:hypothetical protein
MREIFKSGSERGLIVTSGLLPQKDVRYGLYLTILFLSRIEESERDRNIWAWNEKTTVVEMVISEII